MRGLRRCATAGKRETFRKRLKLRKGFGLAKLYGAQFLHSVGGFSLWHCLLLQPTTETKVRIAKKPINLRVRDIGVYSVVRRCRQ